MCPRPANPRVRSALLEAARAEFARHGLDTARVEDITRRAGVSKGAFYLHFASKEEVFRHLLAQFFDELEDLAHRSQEEDREFVRVNGSLSPEDITQGTPRFVRALEFECDRDTEFLEVLWQNRRVLAILDSAKGSAFLPMVIEFRRRMVELVIHGSFEEQAGCCLRQDLNRDAVGDLVVGAYESFARRMTKMRSKPEFRTWARTLLVVIRQGAVVRAGADSEGK